MRKLMFFLCMAFLCSQQLLSQTPSVKVLPSNKVYTLADLRNGTTMDSLVMGVKNYLILQNATYSTVLWSLPNYLKIGPVDQDTLVVVPDDPSTTYISLVFDNYADYFTFGFTSICPTFPPKITADKQSVILGDSATLLMENVLRPNAVLWEWKPLNNNLSFSSLGYIGNPITVKPLYSTVFQTTYAYSDYCLTDVTDTIRVSIPKPTITASKTLPACPYEYITYKTDPNKVNYDWKISGTLYTEYEIISGNLSSSDSIIISWYKPGTHTVTVNYMTSVQGNQKADSAATITTTVATEPVATLTQNPVSDFSNRVCTATPITYKTEAGQQEYTWYVSGTSNTDYKIVSGGTGSADSTVTIQWLAAGGKNIDVSYKNTAGCYSNNPSLVSWLKASPAVSVSPKSATITVGNSTTLTASGATTYSWSPSTGLNTTTGSSVIAAPSTTTTYIVVGTTSGCSDADTSIITVSPPPCTSGVDDKYEQNGNQKSATSLTLATQIYANIKDAKDQDWYTFTTSGAGLYTIEFIPAGGTAVTPELSTSNGTKLSAYSTTQKYTQTFNLTKKTVYYIKINDPKLKGTACYTLKVYSGSAVAAIVPFSKNNSTLNQISEITNLAPAISIFPNPARDVIQIQSTGYSGKIRVQLTDALGRLAKETYYFADGSSAHRFQLNIGRLGKGIYMLVTTDQNNNSSVQKVVIE